MKVDKTIPWATRESTPVERILDLREGASSMKQESGLAQVYAGLGWQHGIDLDDGTLSIKLWED